MLDDFLKWFEKNKFYTNRDNEKDYKYLIIENNENNIRDEVIKNNTNFLLDGGCIIFTNPFEIYCLKKKILVTGIDGQIGYYVKKTFKNYEIFGITNKDTFELEKNILKMKVDITNKDILEKYILSIKPESIIHLAGISCTQRCLQIPNQAILVNGMVCSYMCEIIHKNKLDVKLFNSSTSELFKGHKFYEIKDNDTNHFPTHPYSISKNLSHNIVDWYRKQYGYHFSNGIIFTTESKKRGDTFLTKKLLNHIEAIRYNKSYILKLGNLESNRSFVHANDVSIAIFIILQQEKGDNYNICGDKNYNIKYFLINLYKYYNIELKELENCFYFNNEKIIEFDTSDVNDARPDLNIDRNSIIVGDNSKLKKLGWKIAKNLEEFIEQIDKVI